MKSIETVAKLPVVNLVNAIAGALAGALEALIAFCVIIRKRLLFSCGTKRYTISSNCSLKRSVPCILYTLYSTSLYQKNMRIIIIAVVLLVIISFLYRLIGMLMKSIETVAKLPVIPELSTLFLKFFQVFF